ncbi:MAG: S41 family peptidase [Verrucomicrobiia bacterium]
MKCYGLIWIVAGILFMKSSDALWSQEDRNDMATFSRVMEMVRQHYVDPQKTDSRTLTYGALQGLLDALDSHSQFLTPELYRDLQRETEGQFVGIGLTLGLKDGETTIITPADGSPGAKAGLMAGDKLLQVDGRSTETMSLTEVASRLRGKEGSLITLRVLRKKTQQIEDYTLRRAVIKVQSVREASLLSNELAGVQAIGYIRVAQFSESTGDDFESALKKLESQKIKALILDLRNNPGGLLETAVEVAGKFIAPDQVIVSTEGRSDQSRVILKSAQEEKHRGYPIAILVNTGTASGGEIVAAALRDWHQAILVGETTFGKGSVQSLFPLPDGSALRLTTAYYYTPRHELIQERGVTPDITVVEDSEILPRAVNVLKGILIYSDYAAKQLLPATNINF